MPSTHEVTNQVPLLSADISTFPALLEGLHREGAGWAEPEVRDLGAAANGPEAQEWGRLANEHPPVLRTHDRLRQPGGRGRLPAAVPRAHARRGRARIARGPVGE